MHTQKNKITKILDNFSNEKYDILSVVRERILKAIILPDLKLTVLKKYKTKRTRQLWLKKCKFYNVAPLAYCFFFFFNYCQLVVSL